MLPYQRRRSKMETAEPRPTDGDQERPVDPGDASKPSTAPVPPDDGAGQASEDETGVDPQRAERGDDDPA
jgi:hypothetical protein